MAPDNGLVNLILASEDFSSDDFIKYHHFMSYEENIIRQLMAHGPVLLKGGRGTGKSALLREADRRLNEQNGYSHALGVYLSLRHLPLLRSQGKQYEYELLRILIDTMKKIAREKYDFDFSSEPEVYEVHKELVRLSESIGKRIVLFFDDAAHIGREAALEEFFDVFRTLSSSNVSCKAAIYPGVTKFGNRFDIYNDATIIEISRREDQADFNEFFYAVLRSRFLDQTENISLSKDLTVKEIASFLGQSVVGNVRSFVKACSILFNNGKTIGLQALSEAMLELSRDYYWPMIEEVRLKIGVYEALIEPAEKLAEIIYKSCGEKGVTTCIIHRSLVSKLDKALEILEYSGFLARREVSRGMKSGGRGTRFALNLCNLLEEMPGSRLTKELFDSWKKRAGEDLQFSQTSSLSSIVWPEMPKDKNLGILELPIEKLKKSNMFPYGVTDNKLEILQQHGYDTVGKLAEATDEELLKLEGIGEKTVERFRSVLGQAIWM
ncbi:MAG: helix-hairpin-helix domain-containing protein [Ectobacillus sp.]